MLRLINWLLKFMLGVGLLYGVGLRINTSSSISEGLYWQTRAPVVLGSYVIFCPPPSSVFNLGERRAYFGAGFCPGGYGYLMKQVAGMAGDVININPHGVYVNQVLRPASQPFLVDGLARPLPQLQCSQTLHGHQLLLMTDHSPTSFDARYFGVITPSKVHVIRPLLTW